MIDTLVLSGGGPSGVSYAGILKALVEHDIFQKENLKHIITTSVGIIFAILYLLDYNIYQIEKISLESDFNKILNIEDLEIDDLLVKFGLACNKHVGLSISSFIKHKYNKNDLTLKELYDLTNITLTVKVYNVDKSKTEYINHINNPDIKCTTLSMMTTAIPFIFKPVKYNDNLYVDGGLKGHLPFEACTSDNYLGLNVKGGTCNKRNIGLFKYFPILGFTINLMNDSDKDNIDPLDNKIFTYNIDGGLNFNLNIDERKRMIEKGYNETIEYLKKY